VSGLAYGVLWQETLACVRRNASILFPVAAAFIFLPGLVLTIAESSVSEEARSDGLLWPLLNVAYALSAAAGQLSALIIILDDLGLGRRQVSAAISQALRLLPRQIGVALLSGLATFVGLLLLVLPGLYIASRLSLASAVLVTEQRGVVDSLRGSWERTGASVWRILGYLLIWILIIVGASILAGALAGAVGAVLTIAGAKSVGLLIGQVILAATVATGAVYLQAAVAILYRSLQNPA
jgi:hypothetical protein